MTRESKIKHGVLCVEGNMRFDDKPASGCPSCGLDFSAPRFRDSMLKAFKSAIDAGKGVLTVCPQCGDMVAVYFKEQQVLVVTPTLTQLVSLSDADHREFDRIQAFVRHERPMSSG